MPNYDGNGPLGTGPRKGRALGLRVELKRLVPECFRGNAKDEE